MPSSTRLADVDLGADSVNGSPSQPRFVTEFHPADVFLGRGAPHVNYEGNCKFRELVQSRRHEFCRAERRRRKSAIAREILTELRRRGGRFLRKLETAAQAEELGIPDGQDAWVVVSDADALKKIKQSLRHKAKARSTDMAEGEDVEDEDSMDSTSANDAPLPVAGSAETVHPVVASPDQQPTVATSGHTNGTLQSMDHMQADQTVPWSSNQPATNVASLGHAQQYTLNGSLPAVSHLADADVASLAQMQQIYQNGANHTGLSSANIIAASLGQMPQLVQNLTLPTIGGPLHASAASLGLPQPGPFNANVASHGQLQQWIQNVTPPQIHLSPAHAAEAAAAVGLGHPSPHILPNQQALLTASLLEHSANQSALAGYPPGLLGHAPVGATTQHISAALAQTQNPQYLQLLQVQQLLQVEQQQISTDSLLIEMRRQQVLLQQQIMQTQSASLLLSPPLAQLYHPSQSSWHMMAGPVPMAGVNGVAATVSTLPVVSFPQPQLGSESRQSTQVALQQQRHDAMSIEHPSLIGTASNATPTRMDSTVALGQRHLAASAQVQDIEARATSQEDSDRALRLGHSAQSARRSLASSSGSSECAGSARDQFGAQSSNESNVRPSSSASSSSSSSKESGAMKPRATNTEPSSPTSSSDQPSRTRKAK